MKSDRLAELDEHPERATTGELVFAVLFGGAVLFLLISFPILALLRLVMELTK